MKVNIELTREELADIIFDWASTRLGDVGACEDLQVVFHSDSVPEDKPLHLKTTVRTKPVGEEE